MSETDLLEMPVDYHLKANENLSLNPSSVRLHAIFSGTQIISFNISLILSIFSTVFPADTSLYNNRKQ